METPIIVLRNANGVGGGTSSIHILRGLLKITICGGHVFDKRRCRELVPLSVTAIITTPQVRRGGKKLAKTC